MLQDYYFFLYFSHPLFDRTLFKIALARWTLLRYIRRDALQKSEFCQPMKLRLWLESAMPQRN